MLFVCMKRNISRREVVKSIGAGTSFSALPGLASAREKGEIGITYDPLTGEVIGDATSTINKIENRLVGHLSLNGENINLAKFEGQINQNVENDQNMGVEYGYTGIRDKSKGPSQSSKPARLRITASVDRLSGMYTSATGEKRHLLLKTKSPID